MFHFTYCANTVRNMEREHRRHDGVGHEHLYINELHTLRGLKKEWKPEGAVDWTLTWGVRPWQMYRMGMLSESGPWSTHRSGLRLFLSYMQTHTHTHKDALNGPTHQTHFILQKPQRRRWIKITKNIFLPLSANGESVWKWPEAQLSFVFTMELLIMLFHKRMPIRKTALLALHCDKWNGRPWERKIILSKNYFYNSVLWETMSSIRCSNVSMC